MTNLEVKALVREGYFNNEFDCKYQVVSQNEGSKIYDDIISFLSEYGHLFNGVNESESVRPEIRRQPKIQGLNGGMFNGYDGARPVVRYECRTTTHLMSM
jgi:hypothetical protein